MTMTPNRRALLTAMLFCDSRTSSATKRGGRAAIDGTGGAVIAHQHYTEIGALSGGDGRRFYFDASPSSSFKASSIARMVA